MHVCWTCCARVVDMFGMCFGSALDVCRTCAGLVLAMFGCVLDVCRMCLGRVLDVFGDVCWKCCDGSVLGNGMRSW